MHFASFSDFMAMGGYAFYVWLSYGFVALGLIGVIVGRRASITAQRRKKDPD